MGFATTYSDNYNPISRGTTPCLAVGQPRTAGLAALLLFMLRRLKPHPVSRRRRTRDRLDRMPHKKLYAVTNNTDLDYNISSESQIEVFIQETSEPALTDAGRVVTPKVPFFLPHLNSEPQMPIVPAWSSQRAWVVAPLLSRLGLQQSGNSA